MHDFRCIPAAGHGIFRSVEVLFFFSEQFSFVGEDMPQAPKARDSRKNVVHIYRRTVLLYFHVFSHSSHVLMSRKYPKVYSRFQRSRAPLSERNCRDHQGKEASVGANLFIFDDSLALKLESWYLRTYVYVTGLTDMHIHDFRVRKMIIAVRV